MPCRKLAVQAPARAAKRLVVCSLWLPGFVMLAAAGCSSSTGSRVSRASQARDSGTDSVLPRDASAHPGLVELEDAGSEPTHTATRAPVDVSGCGDGRLQPGEACDDGNDRSGDGCSSDCTKLERDYVCPAPGKACVSSVVCGDSRVSGRESCDDGNQRDHDGCDHQCKIEAGFVCPRPGALCGAAKCGDHIIAGDEQCDDDNDTPTDGDGCSAQCRVEPGWVCAKPGAACRKAVCNDGVKEGGEACDDGNTVLGDGCTPFCEVEPDCSAGACTSRCGDGLLLPSGNEDCDDGNLADGDGCSAQCKLEKGFVCQVEQSALPDTLRVPVTFRDFVSIPAAGVSRHPDFEMFTGNDVTTGLVQSQLGMDGKPVFAGQCDASMVPYPSPPPGTGMCPWGQQMTTARYFNEWYRDTPGENVSKVERMSLMRDPADGAYKNAYDQFFPWDNDQRSLVSLGQELAYSDGHDYGFTSELHTYFQYTPNTNSPQTLSFTGDDDVWVFINRNLCVDIGGSHFEVERSVTLDTATAKNLQLEAGKIYELALFQAERHTPASHFNLTLEGFVSARSQCQPRCGDAVVVGRESCDDGKNDGSYGSCTSECQRAAYCGDGKVDKGHEACDDGVNITTYGADGKPGCAPGCVLSPYCGDAAVDSAAGEACDDGKNTGAYGHCGSSCQLGPRCGDGVVQTDAGETCDDGNLVGGDGCTQHCDLERPE